ncbi:DUF2231 domain-containing protein [Flavobacterium ammonificans]|jgi:uncharacterized membrane protein|uniref:DUF2231 domain-containing protein n=1 Tax=Flavobacterium ammonificans TaxID=1751056 RepID=UPI001E4FE84F|nr:DUF2231 domain-containing protein [Flavobacterium ammonificans]BDB57390.1 hypothetical protein SHINM13_16860 [Flavobacterium ammonificans]
MNDAHLHMVVNHFPIVGTIVAIGILIAGLLNKNQSIINTAYVLFIIGAVFGILSMNTGEGAEELVEDMPGIGWKIIHEHEELAEKMALLLDVLGILSLVGFYFQYKNNPKQKLVSYLLLVLSIASLFVIQKVGTSGGEIRHTEIRNESNATHNLKTDNKHDE